MARYCSEARMKRLSALLALVLLLGLAMCHRSSGESPPLQVSAAASLQDALQVVGQHYEEKTREHVVLTELPHAPAPRRCHAGALAQLTIGVIRFDSSRHNLSNDEERSRAAAKSNAAVSFT